MVPSGYCQKKKKKKGKGQSRETGSPARASLPFAGVGAAVLSAMDFAELEATEGLRWSWNSWPPSRPDAAALVVPLSVMCTPMMPIADLPVLPYDPLLCARCRAALNPYARIDYRSSLWACPFCHHKNPFPRSYAGIGENNLPAELFPTYSTVEFLLSRNQTSNPSSQSGFGLSPSSTASLLSSVSSLGSSLSSSSLPGLEPPRPPGPSFVFVVDVCSAPDELRALKYEILHVVAQLPENALVGLVSFGSMVWVHDLGFNDCSRAVLFCGDRELTSEKVYFCSLLLYGIIGSTCHVIYYKLWSIMSCKWKKIRISIGIVNY